MIFNVKCGYFNFLISFLVDAFCLGSSMLSILGYWRSWRMVAVSSRIRLKRRKYLKADLEHALNYSRLEQGLCAVLWHNWPSNAGFVFCTSWMEAQAQLLNTVCILLCFFFSRSCPKEIFTQCSKPIGVVVSACILSVWAESSRPALALLHTY